MPDRSGFDAGTYGRSFADVYDEWYPGDEATDAAVAALSDLAGPGGRILELGVGTGRLALPLAAAGHPVTGMDASEEMLERLRGKLRGGDATVEVVHGDVGDPHQWPAGPFDVVVAAFNMVFNLPSEQDQARCFDAAAGVLAPGGTLVVEAFVPAPLPERDRRLEVREVTASRVVLIATDADPSTGVVVGQHVELVDGEPVRLRPWRLRVAPPADLDRLAAAAGLELAARHADWKGAPFDPHGATHVSRYRRPGG